MMKLSNNYNETIEGIGMKNELSNRDNVNFHTNINIFSQP